MRPVDTLHSRQSLIRKFAIYSYRDQLISSQMKLSKGDSPLNQKDIWLRRIQDDRSSKIQTVMKYLSAI